MNPIRSSPVTVVPFFSQSKNAPTSRITSIWKTSVQDSHQIYKAFAVILVRLYDAGCALSDSIQYMITKIYAYVLNALGLKNNQAVSQSGLETLRKVFVKYETQFAERVELENSSGFMVTQAVKTDASRWPNGSVQLNGDRLSTQNSALLLESIKTTLTHYCHYRTDIAFDNLTNLLSQVVAGDICSALFRQNKNSTTNSIKAKAPLNGIIQTDINGVTLHLSWNFIYTSSDTEQECGTQKVSRKFFIPWKDLGRNWQGTPLEWIAPGTRVYDHFEPVLKSELTQT